MPSRKKTHATTKSPRWETDFVQNYTQIQIMIEMTPQANNN